MAENIAKSQAFKLKGRLYTFTVLQVLIIDQELFKQQCADTVSKAPKLFDKAPIVFDLSCVNHLELDLQALCKIVHEYGMVPVAIQGGNPIQDTLAQCHGLAILNASSTQDRPIIGATKDTSSQEITKSKLITSPVRSGQQIVAKGNDLIITASVSAGAELLSDGNIHIYGVLRGRALAGISGDLNARIFCQSLEAELVSIAGFYRVSDAIEPIAGPCQIYLINEHIVIEPI